MKNKERKGTLSQQLSSQRPPLQTLVATALNVDPRIM